MKISLIRRRRHQLGGPPRPLLRVLRRTVRRRLQARYASFLNTSAIDALASVGVNVLRVPTTYAAWTDVPGSQYHRGNQTRFLRTVANYAIEKYGMHVVSDLHSLPGGVNGLDIGETFGHMAWFNNQTNLDYSYAAVDAVLAFIKDSGHLNAFTIAPINEAADNLDKFALPAGLSQSSADWIVKYMKGVLAKVEAVDRRIPVMLRTASRARPSGRPSLSRRPTWSWTCTSTTSPCPTPSPTTWCPRSAASRASWRRTRSSRPSSASGPLQAANNNSLAVAERKTNFDTQRFAWQRDASGGSFWNAASYSVDKVDGDGIQRDYWSYVDLINAGVITKPSPFAFLLEERGL
ncbi:glycoside hydrolase [Apiospora phragmitis]|uniref:glucan 1,3-beta-glucosidase n=1 Tax=Apiospora phragmitis TaxID=2905665 RepID=A0ABR1V103_9PEZI